MKAIVKGSLSDVAQRQNQSLAESFMGADVLILVDQSSSMSTTDAPEGQSRYAQAEADVIRLQEKYQGRIAVLSFSNDTRWNPNGVPDKIGGMTNMVEALKYIKVCDDTGMKLILVSDGAPNEIDKTLQIAKTFKTPIECIFVGNEANGRAFLEKLAKLTGGSFGQGPQPGLLAENVEMLMLAG